MTTARTHKTNVSTITGTPRGRIGTPKSEDYLPPAVDADGNLEGGVLSGTAATVYDPANDNIDGVKDYVGKHPNEVATVLEAERDGKDRTTLVEWLESYGQEDEG